MEVRSSGVDPGKTKAGGALMPDVIFHSKTALNESRQN